MKTCDICGKKSKLRLEGWDFRIIGERGFSIDLCAKHFIIIKKFIEKLEGDKT